jgi:ribosomal protein S12 methylthiotransferase
MRTKKKDLSINIVTLGCSKNLVDSEKLMGQLKVNDLKVVHNSETSEARTVVINTCGFIKDAKQESIDTILEYVSAKEKGLIDDVYVMGCLSERYKDVLPAEIPEVDKMFGVNNIEDIVKTLGGDFKQELVGERMISTPSHYAYLKISEGCDRTCSFCAIPLIRGKHKSIPKDRLVTEARSLANKGVKELILIAQDLTYYGVDIYKKQTLGDLLKELSDIDGIEWIRLHYAYPKSFPKDVLEVMRSRKNICNYLDIPFQHVSDNVLRNMRRGINSSQTLDLIKSFREEVPNLTLRTTLLVGHPGEEEEDFEELVNFVKDVRFDRLGVFTYSEEEDTYAAINYVNQIPEEVKQNRADLIMQIQEEISLEKNKEKVGKSFQVIIDRKEGEYFIGRSEGDSPEVDNEILVNTDMKLQVGEFYKIEITSVDSFDLFGIVKE